MSLAVFLSVTEKLLYRKVVWLYNTKKKIITVNRTVIMNETVIIENIYYLEMEKEQES